MHRMHDNKVPNPLSVGGSDRGYFLPPLVELPLEGSFGRDKQRRPGRKYPGAYDIWQAGEFGTGSLIRRLSVKSEPLTLVTGLPVWRIQ